MARADLTLSGTITPPDAGAFAVTADLLAALEGLSHTNPDLQAALGSTARMSMRADVRVICLTSKRPPLIVSVRSVTKTGTAGLPTNGVVVIALS